MSHSKVNFDALNKLCQEHDAHLSMNALKRFEDGKTQRFVTQRMYVHMHSPLAFRHSYTSALLHGERYDIGKVVAEQRFNACLAALEAAGFEIVAKLREYSIYDSNVKLDTGWIDRKKLTSSSGGSLTSSGVR